MPNVASHITGFQAVFNMYGGWNIAKQPLAFATESYNLYNTFERYVYEHLVRLL